MSTPPLAYGRDGYEFPSALLLEREEWGLRSLDVVNPPRRFWADMDVVMPVAEPGIDANRMKPLPMPAALLRALPTGDNWTAQSKRSIARLQAHFLVCEDPQRRMDAREVETLAHQVSLVRHVLETEHLRRVLIADEVGLGKTIEVGLLIKELLEQRSGLRVLYLAPARLVSNVRREFDRMRLPFRQWTAGDGDARLSDPRIIASIQRAVHGNNFDRVVTTIPWDVLIVDECHHLSAWSAGGGDPREAFKLVRDLIGKQPNDGRVIFLSGTPHQGHAARFENLLALLRNKQEPVEALSGRVIYRTKDDIFDWEGNPLFPPRQVNEPLVVDLGPKYRAWIEHIHSFYSPRPRDAGDGEAKRRAAGWRCAQSLQWAASSPQAGLGYLVRQAIRAKWDLSNSVLTEALAALRPYRLGEPNEEVVALFIRILKEVTRQQQEADIEDIEDDVEGVARLQTRGLEELIHEGLTILREAGDEKWRLLKERVLDPAGEERVVLFAQPIETVTALARFLEDVSGRRPALIMGGQSDEQRKAEVDDFCRPDGPRFLVSSRAGGEGINLQVARRLVHVDVPWNPMDMEQRVGRVHRFGSRRPIIVDTLVVKDSREADAYRIARQKLHLVAATLVEKEKFEATFARVMCLIPPEELQSVLISEPKAPFSNEDQEKLARMVQKGFASWQEFHDRFGQRQREIKQQDPGLVAWEDVAAFAKEHAGAKDAAGYTAQKFGLSNGNIEPVEEEARVLRLDGGQTFACGDTGGVPVFGPDGRLVPQLGINLGVMAEALRRVAFPQLACGAAHLRWPATSPKLAPVPLAVVVFMRQTVRPDQHGSWREQGNSLICYGINHEGAWEIRGDEKAHLLRAIFEATVRAKPEQDESLLSMIERREGELAHQTRKPSEIELAEGVRHAVTPLFAATLSE